MSESLESTDEGTIAFSSLEGNSFEEILKGKTVLGIGRVLALTPKRRNLSAPSFARHPATILDADGLNAFAGSGDLFRDANRISCSYASSR